MGKTFRREKRWDDEPTEFRNQKSKKKFVKEKRSKNKRPRVNEHEESGQDSVYHRKRRIS